MEVAEKRHYAVVDPVNQKLVVKYKGEVLLSTTNAQILKEVGKSVYDPVYYFPKEDLKVELGLEQDRQSHCPIKGDATYWNFSENPTSEYFAWSYEDPLPRSKKIAGLIAFNTNYVSICSEPLG